MAAGRRSQCGHPGLPGPGREHHSGHAVGTSGRRIGPISFDRRWLLFTVQAYFFIVGICLTVLTAIGYMPPSLLLAFDLRPCDRRGGSATNLAEHNPGVSTQERPARGHQAEGVKRRAARPDRHWPE